MPPLQTSQANPPEALHQVCHLEQLCQLNQVGPTVGEGKDEGATQVQR